MEEKIVVHAQSYPRMAVFAGGTAQMILLYSPTDVESDL
jgi:hypothetical protein